MKTIFLLLISILCFYSNSFCQGPPPPALEASPENKQLIVELMKVTNYESYFVDYCMQHIETIGAEKGLSAEKILKYKNNINFNQFMNHTIFNHFAVYSQEELLEMIALSKKLNKNNKNYSDVFFSTAILQSNLELQVGIYMLE